MATIRDVMAGLTILAKYDESREEEVSAEHDVLYAGGPDWDALQPGDGAALTDAGWEYNDSLGCWRKFT